MLQCSHLAYKIGSYTFAAHFSIAGTEPIAVIGPSGAGKSTLLDLIAGFRHPHSGQIVLNGVDVTRKPAEARPVSILFQDNNLFPHLTIAQNLALALNPRGWRLSASQTAELETALDAVGLAGLGPRKPGQLSGGQQSRAALARVLLQARPILLLDEPFAALGPALKAEMLALVKQVATRLNALSVLVTHDPKDAAQFAQQTVLVAEGVAHPPAQTKSLFHNPPESLRTYLGNP